MSDWVKRRVLARLDVITFDPGFGLKDSDPNRCPACGSFLDLHQPDAKSPDRLLGICPDCNRWHLIFVEAGPGLTIVTLPIAAPILEDWGQQDGEG